MCDTRRRHLRQVGVSYKRQTENRKPVRQPPIQHHGRDKCTHSFAAGASVRIETTVHYDILCRRAVQLHNTRQAGSDETIRQLHHIPHESTEHHFDHSTKTIASDLALNATVSTRTHNPFHRTKMPKAGRREAHKDTHGRPRGGNLRQQAERFKSSQRHAGRRTYQTRQRVYTHSTGGNAYSDMQYTLKSGFIILPIA